MAEGFLNHYQGTSRGGADIQQIVSRINLWGLDMLFVLGGNGGNAAANAIQEECEKQGVLCSVVGVPKSIDNDILIVSMVMNLMTFTVFVRTMNVRAGLIMIHAHLWIW